ncbi:hypothetical protein E2562_037524 [Oryza meyeriana var. granulata]|uniref:Uncharacterized protein n=1 Tax=Oryza meyeriana var. granulata TaxID=110450 RepID=A0A6G1CB95_9ORYZ|nr:hypothetical protein E2562_037524 [Oryza meyeriana var. granulata]
MGADGRERNAARQGGSWVLRGIVNERVHRARGRWRCATACGCGRTGALERGNHLETSTLATLTGCNLEAPRRQEC